MFPCCSICFCLFPYHVMRSLGFLLEPMLKSFEGVVGTRVMMYLWILYSLTLCTSLCLSCYDYVDHSNAIVRVSYMVYHLQF